MLFPEFLHEFKTWVAKAIICSFSTKYLAVLPVKRIIGKHCLDNATFNQSLKNIKNDHQKSLMENSSVSTASYLKYY